MASTIILSDNGVSSGSAGLKETGGNDGVLILQTTTSGGTATNAVYVDNNQNVGLSATPGTARVTIAAANAVTASRGTAYLYTTDSMAANLGGQISFGGSYTGTSETIFGAVAGRKENGTGADISGYLQLSTTNASLGLVERARIDSSGNLLIGRTDAASNSGTTGTTITVGNSYANGRWYGTSSHTWHQFFLTGTAIGSITGSGSTTAYNTSSDYRLKENIEPMTGALAKVALLKPVTYKWKSDGSDGEGFIAHELAEVAPQCVHGEKDAVDEDGTPAYQGIDTSFLVATLTAAIQEQQALITTLTERITALEAK